MTDDSSVGLSVARLGIRPHLRYASYVVRHKWFVLRAGLRTGAPLWRLVIHDWSKLSLAEWTPYVQTFYGSEPNHWKHAFDIAWLHHQHRNPHHWQHYLLQEDDGALKVLPMPEHFIREMVADWMGAGRAITGKWEDRGDMRYPEAPPEPLVGADDEHTPRGRA